MEQADFFKIRKKLAISAPRLRFSYNDSERGIGCPGLKDLFQNL